MVLNEVELHPTERQLRQFAGLVLPLAAALVGAMLYWRFELSTPALIVFAATAILAVMGLVRPALVRPFYAGWMIAAYPIGWVMSHILIAAIFFLVLTPIGLLMRFFGRDPLHRQFEPDRESYWEPREPVDDTDRYFRQF